MSTTYLPTPPPHIVQDDPPAGFDPTLASVSQDLATADTLDQWADDICAGFVHELTARGVSVSAWAERLGVADWQVLGLVADVLHATAATVRGMAYHCDHGADA